MKLKTKTEIVIDDSDWDELVKETYGRPYCFQQQGECRDRGVYRFKVPDTFDYDKYTEDDVSDDAEDNATNYMGVKFAKWLERDPNQPLLNQTDDWQLEMWWERDFYPDLNVVANDLHKRGLLDAGEYTIDVNW